MYFKSTCYFPARRGAGNAAMKAAGNAAMKEPGTQPDSQPGTEPDLPGICLDKPEKI